MKNDFEWYWRSPFTDPGSVHFFERDHWWTERADEIPHFSTEYEFLRRHPTVGLALSQKKQKSKSTPVLLDFLCEHGRISWPRLAPDLRNRFLELCNASHVINLSGKAIEKVGPVRFSAKDKFLLRTRAVARKGEAILATIQRLAKDESLKGKLILSVPWDSSIALEQITFDVLRVLTHWRERNLFEASQVPDDSGRDTSADRLRKLVRFECSERQRYIEDTGKRLRKKAVTGKSTNQRERRAFRRLCEKIGSQFL